MGSSAPVLKPTTGHRLFLRPPPATRHRRSRVDIPAPSPFRSPPATRVSAREPPPLLAVAGKEEIEAEIEASSAAKGLSRRAVVAAAVAMAVAAGGGLGEEEAALALGPEGPLVEEFWDNVRRYGLYALTVSTGAIYTILQPILELLRNPLSALLLLLLLAGGFFLLSQTLSFMVGINDFSYEYAP